MPSLFSHLLVPVDFTEKNAAALRIARELAVQNHARVTLLHVIEPVEQAEDDAEFQEFIRMLESKAETSLEALAGDLTAAGVTVRQELLTGRRGAEILRYAVDQQVDLVVLSSHRVDPQQPQSIWQGLSYQVSILCPCPVLLVK